MIAKRNGSDPAEVSPEKIKELFGEDKSPEIPSPASFVVDRISADSASDAIAKITLALKTVSVVDVVITNEQDQLFTAKVTVDCAYSVELAKKELKEADANLIFVDPEEV